MFNNKLFNLFVFCFLPLVTACGGGSSSSGGEPDNDVSFCIVVSDEVNFLGVTERTYLNNCGFAVNIGIGLVSISRIEVLGVNESITTIVRGGFIACRPPSMPFDADDSGARDFRCA